MWISYQSIGVIEVSLNMPTVETNKVNLNQSDASIFHLTLWGEEFLSSSCQMSLASYCAVTKFLCSESEIGKSRQNGTPEIAVLVNNGKLGISSQNTKYVISFPSKSASK